MINSRYCAEEGLMCERPRVSHKLPDIDILAQIGAIALIHTQLENQLRTIVGDLLSLTKEEALFEKFADESKSLLLNVVDARLGAEGFLNVTLKSDVSSGDAAS
jgi:hypothetical protein